jgi:hypothetical protein
MYKIVPKPIFSNGRREFDYRTRSGAASYSSMLFSLIVDLCRIIKIFSHILSFISISLKGLLLSQIAQCTRIKDMNQ